MKLVILGSGRAILELPTDVRPEVAHEILGAWRRWCASTDAQNLLAVPGTVEVRFDGPDPLRPDPDLTMVVTEEHRWEAAFTGDALQGDRS